MPTAGDPVFASDVANLANFTTARPAGRALASATQSIPNNTNTAIALGAEDIDTHGFHDIVTNNSRITPTAGWAGYYRFSGAVIHGTRADYSTTDAFFRKNGTTSLAPGNRKQPPLISGFQAVHTFCTVALDPGSGDYLELMGLQVNGAAAAQVTGFSGVLICTVEWEFLRPL